MLIVKIVMVMMFMMAIVMVKMIMNMLMRRMTVKDIGSIQLCGQVFRGTLTN